VGMRTVAILADLKDPGGSEDCAGDVESWGARKIISSELLHFVCRACFPNYWSNARY